jgi:hypothetical protein
MTSVSIKDNYVAEKEQWELLLCLDERSWTCLQLQNFESGQGTGRRMETITYPSVFEAVLHYNTKELEEYQTSNQVCSPHMNIKKSA